MLVVYYIIKTAELKDAGMTLSGYSRSSAMVPINTSSSADVDRPRDASCLSAVSLNSTVHRGQSSVIG